MVADAQEGSPEEVTPGVPTEAEMLHDDAVFDRGWKAGAAATAEHIKADANQVRIEGFQEGFKAGFKEGYEVGKHESTFVVKTYPPVEANTTLDQIHRLRS